MERASINTNSTENVEESKAIFAGEMRCGWAKDDS
jgi:hypothetical protein